MAKFIIYRAICKKTGKAYIGQTRKTLDKRRAKHISNAQSGIRGCPRFYEAIRKHGYYHFEWDILACPSSQEEANRLERKYIAQFGTQIPSGYNISPGGGEDLIHPETIEGDDIAERREAENQRQREETERRRREEEDRRRIAALPPFVLRERKARWELLKALKDFPEEFPEGVLWSVVVLFQGWWLWLVGGWMLVELADFHYQTVLLVIGAIVISLPTLIMMVVLYRFCVWIFWLLRRAEQIFQRE